MTAFYAPLKPVDHPTPSGDRAMARALLRLLAEPALAERFGAPSVASSLRAREGAGDAAAQDTLFRAAAQERGRLAAAATRLWLTYHNYYKAPDLLGPWARARGALYAIVEPSRASRRRAGSWARMAAAADAATAAADALFVMTARDWPAIVAARRPGQVLRRLPPFLDRDALPAQRPEPSCRKGPINLLAVAMLRPGDKAASYAALAAALGRMAAPWRLDIVGDGPAEAEIRALFSPFDADHVRFLGRLDGAALDGAYADADVFVWPGVNEAYGLVYLEAQAAGLPVVSEDRPGVRDVARAGALRAPPGDPDAFAAALDALAGDRDRRAALANAGRTQVAADHLRGAAAMVLAEGLAEAAERRGR